MHLKRNAVRSDFIAEKYRSSITPIRFIPIENYKDLYLALLQNLSIISSVQLSKLRLSKIKQIIAELVESYNNSPNHPMPVKRASN